MGNQCSLSLLRMRLGTCSDSGGACFALVGWLNEVVSEASKLASGAVKQHACPYCGTELDHDAGPLEETLPALDPTFGMDGQKTRWIKVAVEPIWAGCLPLLHDANRGNTLPSDGRRFARDHGTGARPPRTACWRRPIRTREWIDGSGSPEALADQ